MPSIVWTGSARDTSCSLKDRPSVKVPLEPSLCDAFIAWARSGIGGIPRDASLSSDLQHVPTVDVPSYAFCADFCMWACQKVAPDSKE